LPRRKQKQNQKLQNKSSVFLYSHKKQKIVRKIMFIETQGLEISITNVWV